MKVTKRMGYGKGALLAAVGLLMINCTAARPPLPSPGKIEGVKWSLQSFGYSKMAVPARADLWLEKGRYGAFLGCNRMGGSYEKRGNYLRLKPGIKTLIACPALSLENRYQSLLLRVRRYRVEGGGRRLLLLGERGSVLLIYARRGR